ncbi:MAG: aminotransferase class I/II-fold pyridoxal phosphate-dependent enzyme [Acidimicrobiaceae bacterium]|nr:aminotransferase class I/II-fold pyridoxal phosphate-dependent enzyme [Acidimicrobiaceae bacterium]
MLGADLKRLHSLSGVKWTDDPDRDVIPSWVADMDFEVAPVIKTAMQAVIDRGDTGYNFHARKQLVGAWGDWQERHFGWRPPEEESMVFTATLNCLNLVMEFMTEPGDGVVVFTPIYYPFRAIINDTGRRLVDVPLTGPDWRLDPERFEAAIDPGTKMVLWCNPHNPLGRMFDADEIAAFADVCERHDLLVISDEIWCDITFQDGHVPLWRNHESLRNRMVTLGSASKTFNVAGLRTAVAHIGDPRVRARFEKLGTHFIAGPNTLGAEASLAAWTQGQPWLDKVKSQLHINRDHLAARVAADLPGATMTLPEATYLAWIDLSGSGLEGNPSETFRERGKITVHDGAKFCASAASCVRVNFATSPEILDLVIDRMANVLQEATS